MNYDCEAASNEARSPSGERTPTKRPQVATHPGHVAPSKAKSATKATSAKKADKGAKSAESPNKVTCARQDSKTVKFLGLLKRSGGASLKELMKATGWQAHSVRGFISGALGKRMGLRIKSTKLEGGERRYSIKN